MQQHDQQKRNRKRMNPIEELKEPMIPHIRHREDQNDNKQHQVDNSSRISNIILPRKQWLKIVIPRISAHIIQIDKMHKRMNERLDENHNADDLMNLYKVVDGQKSTTAFLPDPSKVFAENKNENEGAVKVQAISHDTSGDEPRWVAVVGEESG